MNEQRGPKEKGGQVWKGKQLETCLAENELVASFYKDQGTQDFLCFLSKSVNQADSRIRERQRENLLMWVGSRCSLSFARHESKWESRRVGYSSSVPVCVSFHDTLRILLLQRKSLKKWLEPLRCKYCSQAMLLLSSKSTKELFKNLNI